MENWELRELVEAAFDDRERLKDPSVRKAVEEVVARLDAGSLRCAEPDAMGVWVVREWVKKAVLLYFPIREMESYGVGPYEYYDKIPLKRNWPAAGVRVIPPAVVRYGAFVGQGAILMPSYVNIGSWVGPRTMVDTWATVGTCAQIGADVHLSGGVGIGGVLEPPQASPVIIGDGAFVGSRAVIVEGVQVGERAVIGAGVVLTASTRIIDVTGPEPVVLRGVVPPDSVVIPGHYPKEFPAGTYHVPCALLIGRRTASTDLKTSLNMTLREFDVPV